jgi:predicted HTH domain antitoxin
MTTIQIDLPDEISVSLKEAPAELEREIRMAAAAKLYELGKLSSGRAAQLANVTRVAFLQALGRYGVAILDLSREELVEDLKNA